MGRRSYPGGIITGTELTVNGYGAGGMWSLQTHAQKKNSGVWPLPGVTPTGPAVGPTISNVSVTDSSYNVLNDTPYIDSAGGYIRVLGTGFASGAVVYVGGSAAVVTSFVSSTEVRAQVAAGTTSNAFPVYVVNSDSSVAIKLAAVTYSGSPTWSTSATLVSQLTDTAFSISLSAISDSSISYSLAAGSSLPPGTALSSGGVFSGTVAGLAVDATYSFTVVANDAENQDASRTFTVTVVAGDQYINLTPLLLNGESTTWITDASANKLLPTVTGDSKPTAFSPYNTNWSLYFSGANNYLTVAANAGYNPGNTGAWTFECFVYPINNTGGAFYGHGNGAAYGNALSMAYGSNQFAFNQSNGSSTPVSIASASSYPPGRWYHYAICKDDSNVMRLFIDGVQVGTQTYSSSIAGGGQPFINGLYDNIAFGRGGGAFYLSDVHWVVGTALYTTTPFTPPTGRISAVANTKILIGQTRRFLDTGSLAGSWTVGGTVRVAAFGPFAETDTTTGSAFFDGNGDYLTFPTSTGLNFSTGDFTIEFWAYLTANPANDWMFISAVTSGSNGLFFGVANFTAPYGIGFGRAGTAWDYLSTVTPVLNTWNHYVLTRTGTSVRIFVNGVQIGTTQTLATSYDLGLGGMTVGAEIPGTLYMTGYMTDLRVVKGVGVYTGTFTPTTSLLPLTQSSGTNVAAITGTSTSISTLQYHRGENNHRFIDESGAKNLMLRAGNATQGTFSPYSPAGWSGFFNGSSDYLTVAGNNVMNFGSSNWTVECWVYLNTLPTSDAWPTNYTNHMVIITVGTSSLADGVGCIIGGTKLLIQNNDSTTLSVNNHGLTTATWYHLAYVRVGNTINFYVNGTALGAGVSYVGSVGTGGTTWIGSETAQGAYFNGYISNLRVVNGLAVYTGNFTVPNTILTATQSSGSNIAAITTGQTSLLALQNNRFIDANATPKTISTGSTTRIQAFSPFKPGVAYSPTLHGGSAYFDGSGDAIYNTTALVTNFDTSDFTVEYWVYPTVSVNGYTQHVGAATTSTGIAFGSGSNMGLYATTSTVGIGGNLTVIINQWNHIAWTRQSGFLRGYLNGSVGYSASFTTSLNEAATTIGSAQSGASYPLTGYISDLRVLKGNAVYTTSTITVPTSPSALTPNVALKLSFTQGGIVDATARNVIETVGDVKIGNVQSKFGTGAIYFDGTGDYLSVADTPQWNFGSGNFTMEFWTYITAYTSDFKFIIKASSVTNYWQFSFNNGGTIGPNFNYNNAAAGQVIVAQQGNTTGWATNTWYHVALVRNGTAVNIYKDGVSVASGTLSGALLNPSATVVIGGSSVSTSPLNGYIDDLRVSTYARYTANFTVPTISFPTK